MEILWRRRLSNWCVPSTSIVCSSLHLWHATAFSTEPRILVHRLIPSAAQELNDPDLGNALERLREASRLTDTTFEPKAVAGRWRVVHAPHLAFLSKFVLCKFQPIEYYLTSDGRMAASVRYKSSIFGEGWLSTAGYYTTEGSTVRIVWNQTWWNNSPMERPSPPEEGFQADLIQSLGEIGFIEPLSFFPIQYVDEDLAIFKFFGFTITASRFDKSTTSLYGR